jgi:hypothetical protein
MDGEQPTAEGIGMMERITLDEAHTRFKAQGVSEPNMHSHARFALDHPVYDPERQIITGHYWRADRDVSACLTVNIGQE